MKFQVIAAALVFFIDNAAKGLTPNRTRSKSLSRISLSEVTSFHVSFGPSSNIATALSSHQNDESLETDSAGNEFKSLFVNNNTSSRRDSLIRSASIFAGIASGFGLPSSSIAAKTTYPQEKEDKEKIVKGYKRLNYLVDNWEKETTVCKKGQDNPYLGCDRTPEKVMEYLGFKSMDDPLFRADKTLMRLEALVPSENEGDFIDAMEVFNEKSEEGSGIAFVSSWGEANPGGGKDRVELFIERSKNDVIQSRDSLATVIRILNLKAD